MGSSERCAICAGHGVVSRKVGTLVAPDVREYAIKEIPCPRCSTKGAYPLLQGLINSGDITWLGTDLIGHASDGTIVSMGSEFNLAAIERYLTKRPTPDTW